MKRVKIAHLQLRPRLSVLCLFSALCDWRRRPAVIKKEEKKVHRLKLCRWCLLFPHMIILISVKLWFANVLNFFFFNQDERYQRIVPLLKANMTLEYINRSIMFKNRAAAKRKKRKKQQLLL